MPIDHMPSNVAIVQGQPRRRSMPLHELGLSIHELTNIISGVRHLGAGLICRIENHSQRY
jgi:hypothetical protein